MSNNSVIYSLGRLITNMLINNKYVFKIFTNNF